MGGIGDFFAGRFGHRQATPQGKALGESINTDTSLTSDFPHRAEVKGPMPVRRLVIGFDFGSSCSKVVIGDHILARHYLVPAVRPATSDTTYLQAGVIYEDRCGNFSLLESSQASAHRNIKLKFLASLGETRLDVPDSSLDAELIAVLFLARMFAHTRQWFEQTHGSQYGNCELQWSVNVGLPSRDACDRNLRPAYEKAVGVAWAVSLKGNFTLGLARGLRDGTAQPAGNRIRAYPEVAAELETFRRSEFGEYGRFLLVDVGAGTLDVSTFAINEGGEDNDRIYFYSTEVAHLGAFRWHENRLRRLRDTGLRLTRQTPREEVDYAIPTDISEFGGATRAERENLQFQIQKADSEFKSSCADVIVKAVMATHIHLSRTGNRNASAFRNEVPAFLCGGGARLQFYEDVLGTVRDRLGKYLDWSSSPGLTRRKIADLRNLIAPRLPPSDLDRFAVAYGLSFEHRDLPYIRVGDLSTELRRAKENPADWRDRVTVEQASRILNKLLYPPLPPDHELREIRLKRPVTIDRLTREHIFEGIEIRQIRMVFSKKVGFPLSDYSEISDEHVVDVLRVNRCRPRFFR